jgi:hypothetical protein
VDYQRIDGRATCNDNPVPKQRQRLNLYGFSLFSPSYQSDFQLSLALLVCYRSPIPIFSFGRNSTPVFGLYFQTTLLGPESDLYEPAQPIGLSPTLYPGGRTFSNMLYWTIRTEMPTGATPQL